MAKLAEATDLKCTHFFWGGSCTSVLSRHQHCFISSAFVSNNQMISFSTLTNRKRRGPGRGHNSRGRWHIKDTIALSRRSHIAKRRPEVLLPCENRPVKKGSQHGYQKGASRWAHSLQITNLQCSVTAKAGFHWMTRFTPNHLYPFLYPLSFKIRHNSVGAHSKGTEGGEE